MITHLTTNEDNVPFIAQNIGATKVGRTFGRDNTPFSDHYLNKDNDEVLCCMLAFQPYEDKTTYTVFDPPRQWADQQLDYLEWKDL